MRHIKEWEVEIATIAELGRRMPARAKGLTLTAQEGVSDAEALDVLLRLGTRADPVRLRCVVTEQWQVGEATWVQVAPDRESWKKMFLSVCQHAWQREEDIEDSRGRLALSEAAWCYVPGTGHRYEAMLQEVSRGGAFLRLSDDVVGCGEQVRFRRLADMTWHSAEVRWRGMKRREPGVGIALRFGAPEERFHWVDFVSAAKRRVA